MYATLNQKSHNYEEKVFLLSKNNSWEGDIISYKSAPRNSKMLPHSQGNTITLDKKLPGIKAEICNDLHKVKKEEVDDCSSKNVDQADAFCYVLDKHLDNKTFEKFASSKLTSGYKNKIEGEEYQGPSLQNGDLTITQSKQENPCTCNEQKNGIVICYCHACSKVVVERPGSPFKEQRISWKALTADNTSRKHKKCKVMYSHKRIKCNVCDLKLSSNWALKNHMFKHSGEKPFPCDECNKGKRFATAYKLKRHQFFSCRGKDSYICSECGKTFSNASSVVRHKKIHSSVKQLGMDCKVDGNELTPLKEQNILCNTSKKTDHTSKKFKKCKVLYSRKKIKCKVCDLKLSSNWALKNHMFKHGGEKPFPCDECDKGKRFATAYKLKRHQFFSCRGKDNCTCSVCGKTFSNVSSVVRHKKIHSSVMLTKDL